MITHVAAFEESVSQLTPGESARAASLIASGRAIAQGMDEGYITVDRGVPIMTGLARLLMLGPTNVKVDEEPIEGGKLEKIRSMRGAS